MGINNKASLLQSAEAIRTEKEVGKNSAQRVGQMFADIVNNVDGSLDKYIQRDVVTSGTPRIEGSTGLKLLTQDGDLYIEGRESVVIASFFEDIRLEPEKKVLYNGSEVATVDYINNKFSGINGGDKDSEFTLDISGCINFISRIGEIIIEAHDGLLLRDTEVPSKIGFNSGTIDVAAPNGDLNLKGENIYLTSVNNSTNRSDYGWMSISDDGLTLSYNYGGDRHSTVELKENGTQFYVIEDFSLKNELGTEVSIHEENIKLFSEDEMFFEASTIRLYGEVYSNNNPIITGENNGITRILKMTQAQYSGLSQKDENTMYVIID